MTWDVKVTGNYSALVINYDTLQKQWKANLSETDEIIWEPKDISLVPIRMIDQVRDHFGLPFLPAVTPPSANWTAMLVIPGKVIVENGSGKTWIATKLSENGVTWNPAIEPKQIPTKTLNEVYDRLGIINGLFQDQTDVTLKPFIVPKRKPVMDEILEIIMGLSILGFEDFEDADKLNDTYSYLQRMDVPCKIIGNKLLLDRSVQ